MSDHEESDIEELSDVSDLDELESELSELSSTESESDEDVEEEVEAEDEVDVEDPKEPEPEEPEVEEEDDDMQIEAPSEEPQRPVCKRRVRMDRFCKSLSETKPRAPHFTFDHPMVINTLCEYTTERNAALFAPHVRTKEQLFEVCGKLIQKEYTFKVLYAELRAQTAWRETRTYAEQRQKEATEIEIATTSMKVVEGLYQCSRCKSKKTYSRQVQTRSADEGMTSIIQCIECNKVWREYA
jgi:DNA-directed RNA polymerase subunit M/transcription elongation factor TFIIS